MKAKIHPSYFQAKVVCACGNEFTVGSTKEEIKVEICSACHPFYTGKQKLVDTAGRVDRFKDLMAKKEEFDKKAPKPKAKKKTTSKKKAAPKAKSTAKK